MRRKNEIILWPVYFDSSKSRGLGRRLPKRLTVPSPNVDMLERAVKNLSLKYEVFPEAAYPRLPWIKIGFIAVERGKKRKSHILKEVAAELTKISSRSPSDFPKKCLNN